MKKWLVFVLLILSCGSFMGLKLRMDRIPRKKIPGSSIIYIPSGKHLKYAAFGHSGLAADLVYLWAIQYYSTYSISDRFDHLDHIFSIISELDPLYLDPYEIGAIIAVYEAQDLELCLRILDRGLENNPGQWLLPFEAAHYAEMIAKDYQTARAYYEKAMRIPGAPPLVRRLHANTAFRLSDYSTAWQNWLEIYQSAEDERIRKIASNHLYQVKAAQDIKILQSAMEVFLRDFGRRPRTLEELVQAGKLPALPRDFDDQPYTYDPKTGEIRSASIPWKR